MRVISAAWAVAEASGAPLAPALDRIGAALRGVNALERRRAVLLATPRMTVRLIALLPIASIGASALFGFNPLPVFLTPLGALLLVVGVVLQWIGALWARSIVAAMEARDRAVGLECELVWIALSGGAPPGGAMLVAADAVCDARAEWIPLDSFCADRPLAEALRTAEAAGVPAAGLLLETAGELRERARTELEQEGERFGVRILFPVAVCALPAFVALGVMPVVIRMLAGAFSI